MSRITDRKRRAAESHIAKVLAILGADITNSDMRETPRRVISMMEEMTAGLRSNDLGFKFTLFDSQYDQLVIAKDVHYASICSHHFLPFFGKAHIGYLPSDKLAGWSKLPRLVRYCAARPQMQETLTNDIADLLVHHLKPQAVIVVLTGVHTCARVRGVKDPESVMITSALRGDRAFGIRDEFMRLIDVNR